jgi:cysteine synthase A
MVAGYREMGAEIARQVDGPVDAFCAYVGTAGCFLGVTGVLVDHSPDLARVAIEPTESAVLSGHPPGTHRSEGGGVGFVPPLRSPNDFDRVEAVSTDEAMAMARRAARTEGIFSGPSTGANLVVALRMAAELGAGRRVVTVQCDSGLKYLAGDLYRATDGDADSGGTVG